MVPLGQLCPDPEPPQKTFLTFRICRLQKFKIFNIDLIFNLIFNIDKVHGPSSSERVQQKCYEDVLDGLQEIVLWYFLHYTATSPPLYIARVICSFLQIVKTPCRPKLLHAKTYLFIQEVSPPQLSESQFNQISFQELLRY